MDIEPITVERFFNKVSKTDSCWIWTGAKGHFGYGVIRINNKLIYAHRVSFLIEYGIIPNDLCVLHTCDNPVCVNPKHLFLGTKNDNIKDCVSKNRQYQGRKHHSAKLTEIDVLCIRALYAWSKFDQYEIASEFGVTQGLVSAIIRGVKWKSVRTNFLSR